jgi:hypothetical protein
VYYTIYKPLDIQTNVSSATQRGAAILYIYTFRIESKDVCTNKFGNDQQKRKDDCEGDISLLQLTDCPLSIHIRRGRFECQQEDQPGPTQQHAGCVKSETVADGRRKRRRAATARPFVIITVVQFTIANKTRGRRRSRADFFLEKRRKKSTTLGCSKRLTESNRFQLAHQQTHNRPRNEERIKAGTIDRDNIITQKH